MENTPITPQQSLDIIQQMIHNARQEFKDNGFLYLLWGWLAFAAAAAHYVLLKAGYVYSFIPWMICMPAGAVVSIIYGMTVGKKQLRKARTWVDTVMAYTWSAFGVGMVVVLALGSQAVGFERSYPYVLLLYGMGTFISGGVMQFRWLIWGGVFCWILCGVAFFVDFEWQVLMVAAAMLVAYIIPGHILQYQYRRNV